jgi:aminopeptidase-like protein
MTVLELKIIEAPSVTKAFYWTAPSEWNMENTLLADEKGIPIVKPDKKTLMSDCFVLISSAVFGKKIVTQVCSLVGLQDKIIDYAAR